MVYLKIEISQRYPKRSVRHETRKAADLKICKGIPDIARIFAIILPYIARIFPRIYNEDSSIAGGTDVLTGSGISGLGLLFIHYGSGGTFAYGGVSHKGTEVKGQWHQDFTGTIRGVSIIRFIRIQKTYREGKARVPIEALVKEDLLRYIMI